MSGEQIFGDTIRAKTVYYSDYFRGEEKVRAFERKMEEEVRIFLETKFAEEFSKELKTGDIEIYF